jgi:hypothetical protein
MGACMHPGGRSALAFIDAMSESDRSPVSESSLLPPEAMGVDPSEFMVP